MKNVFLYYTLLLTISLSVHTITVCMTEEETTSHNRKMLFHPHRYVGKIDTFVLFYALQTKGVQTIEQHIQSFKFEQKYITDIEDVTFIHHQPYIIKFLLYKNDHQFSQKIFHIAQQKNFSFISNNIYNKADEGSIDDCTQLKKTENPHCVILTTSFHDKEVLLSTIKKITSSKSWKDREFLNLTNERLS